MFVRTRKRDNGTTQVQIVENYRQGAKVVQRLVRSVGHAASERELAQFMAIAEAAIVELKNQKAPVLSFQDPYEVHAPKRKGASKESCEDEVKVKNIRHEKSINDGYRELFGEVYSAMGLDEVLETERKTDHWNSLLRDLSIARIAEPDSKLQTHRKLRDEQEISYGLDSVYDLMDHVVENSDRIKAKVCQSTTELFENKVDVLFYDVTTLYFESTERDDLRNFGFSKDCKFKEVQVVLALITTTDGLPLSYKLFPGNTNEGKTLIPTIIEMKKEFDLNRVVMAADRAMFTEENLAELDKNNVRYVVAAKLKGMSKKQQKEILNAANYALLKNRNEQIWVGEFEHKGRRLISALSYKRAEKDAKDRQRLIDRLQKKTKDGQVKINDIIPNHGTKRYLKIIDGKAEVNKEKIEQDALWDGMHGVITNDRDSSAAEILSWYHGLWQIEEAFRVNKHTLEMRPIYHWTKERIEAHILICFIAFAVLKQTLVRLKRKNLDISGKELIYQLKTVQLHRILDIATGKRYLVPSTLNNHQKKIFTLLGIKRSTEPRPC